jgi:hypothetical protein
VSRVPGVDLYGEYSEDQLLSLVYGNSRPQRFCAGQFFLAGEQMACVVQVAPDVLGTHFPGPSTLCWVASDLHGDPLDEVPWFPQPLRGKVWRPGGGGLLFVRRPPDQLYLYAGEARVASHGDDYLPRPSKTVRFRLTPKLRKDVWRRVGSFRDWCLRLNDIRYYILSGGQLDGLLAAAWAQEYADLTLSGYEEDALNALTNPHEALLTYSTPTGGIKTARDLLPRGDPATLSDFYSSNEELTQMHSDEVLGKDTALAVLRHFYATGELPTFVSWRTWR